MKSQRTTTVTVLGVGRIGSALVGRFVAAGMDVIGHDVDPGRRRSVEEHGGRWVTSLDAAVSDTDVVITALPGSPELARLADTLLILLARPSRAALWIDVTSASYEVGRHCSIAAAEAGVEYVGAPLGGGVDAVASGTATLYAGGETETIQTAMPLLRTFSDHVHHVGGHGAGHLVKLLVNTLWFGQVGLVTEALLLAERHGITAETFGAALAGSAADSTFVQDHLAHLAAGDPLADFGLDRCVEELVAVADTATAADLPHPVTSAVVDLHRNALNRFGPVDGELLAASWLREQGTWTAERDLSARMRSTDGDL